VRHAETLAAFGTGEGERLSVPSLDHRGGGRKVAAPEILSQ
jgi:hypothetical protein